MEQLLKLSHIPFVGSGGKILVFVGSGILHQAVRRGIERQNEVRASGSGRDLRTGGGYLLWHGILQARIAKLGQGAGADAGAI